MPSPPTPSGAAAKAIKHAYAVVNRPALVDKTAFDLAKDFTRDATLAADSARDIVFRSLNGSLAEALAAIADNTGNPSAEDAPVVYAAAVANVAFHITAFAEYVVAKVVENTAHCSCDRSKDAVITAATHASALTARVGIRAAAFAKEAKDLERRFNKWQSQKT
ncbi:hypothetical protein AGMMS49593_07170 [Endomicrobiia bacterium]|nr:hypothetical protein AGMMS49593_07170 [Endomicrobiia bacterium]